MIEVEIIGKGIVEFPDDMTSEQIKAVLKKNPPFPELRLQPAHKPTELKQKPFLKRFGEKLAVPFEAIGKGLAESKYVQPIEGGGIVGDISNILVQPTRVIGQMGSIPFTETAKMLKGEQGAPPPDIDFSDVEAIIKEEGLPSAITKYGLDMGMMVAAKLGIPITPLLQQYKIPALSPLAQRMRRAAPVSETLKKEPLPKPPPKVTPKEITPETFGETQAIPLSKVEEAQQMKDLLREQARKEIAEELTGKQPAKEYVPPTEPTAQPLKGTNWRQAFDKTTDIFRKSDILHAVADAEKVTPKELSDILSRVKGLPEESNIRWAVSQKAKTLPPEVLKDYPELVKPKEGGTALYSGIPIPEMAKMLKNVSKESAEAVKFLLEKYDIPKAFEIAVERGYIQLSELGYKERGFITSVKGLYPNLERVKGQYIPRPTDPLAKKAKTLIQTDIATAERIATTGTDEIAVANASELIKYYNDLAQKAPEEQVGLFYDKAAEYANVIAPKLTELGRGVQAASIIGRLTPEGQLRFAAREIQRYNEQIAKRKFGKKIPELSGEQAQIILRESKRIFEMPDGVEKAMVYAKLQNYIADLTPTPLMKKITTIWKAGLLTGIKTSGLNVSSTGFNTVFEIIKDIPGVPVDAVASLFTGERTLPFTLKGFAGGVKEGFGRGWRYFKTGFDERNVGVKLDYRRISMGKSKLAKGIQTYTETVFRALGSEDQPFYYGMLDRSLQSQAIAQAKNAKLKGIEAKKFIEDLTANPTDEMLQYAVNDAEITTFINRTLLGEAGKAIQKTGVGEFVVPFARTPSAVAMQLVNYSPVGIIKTIAQQIGKGKFDQRLFSQAMGRGITGTAILYLGTKLFEKGLVTLERPQTEKEQKQWELEGKKPNSIKIGNEWRNVNVFGPQGLVLLIGGHFQREFNETGSWWGAITKATAGGAKSLTEQTFLKGLNSVVDALNDPSRFGSGLATSMAGSVVPTIIGDIARATDVAERRIESPLQSIKSRIPGLRETLEPRINVFGEPLERGGSFLETMIDPSRPSEIRDTPLVVELKRLWDKGYRVTPALLGDKKGYEGLTPEQNTELWELTGRTLQSILNLLVRKSWYQKLTDERKARVITKLTRMTQEYSRAVIINEIIPNLSNLSPEEGKTFREFNKQGLLTEGVFRELLNLQSQEQAK